MGAGVVLTVFPRLQLKVRAVEDGSVPDEEAKELFKVAVQTHSNYAKDALVGRGADRHLFGLCVNCSVSFCLHDRSCCGIDVLFARSPLLWLRFVSRKP
jgi:hypothetical protein